MSNKQPTMRKCKHGVPRFMCDICKPAPSSFAGTHGSAKYKWNPAHPIGTCGLCGGEMIYNVPRLGADGGYCHKETDDIRCPSSPNEKGQQ
jgi:hypothetical protein